MAVKTTTYKDVPDNMIAAWRPVTARMFTRMNNNSMAVADHELLVNNIGNVGGSNGTVAWVTVGTVRLFIPAHCVDRDGKTTVVLYLKITLSGSSGASPEAKGRLKIGSVEGNSSSESASTLPLTCKIEPTGDTVYDVRIQAWVNDALNTATVNWLDVQPGIIFRGWTT